MSNNRTFFKKVQQGKMTLKDIFSDVFKKHTAEESAQVLIAGTALTTPRESEMLSNWQKPFMFARFLLACAIVVGLSYFMAVRGWPGMDTVLVLLACVGPITMLLLTWELNISRNISLFDTLKWVAIGGMMSLIFTMLFNIVLDIFSLLGEFTTESASWAAVVEEPAKLAIVYYIIKKKDYKFVLNGILVGMAVGTGFAVLETLSYIMRYTLAQGYEAGLTVAVIRGLGSFSSHGTYAAIYGGGLMLAKGSDPLKLNHLLHKDHLLYFVAAMILHACNNSTVVQVVMNYYLGTFGWIILEAVVMFSLLFLPLIRRGVNQIVEVTSAHNGGRVTMAVNRGAAGAQVDYVPAEPVAHTFILEGVAGPMAGRSFPIRGRITLGRSAGCDISLAGASNVSGTHCAIQLVGGQVTVTDLGSTNGTYIGGRRLMPNQSVAVTSGTVIYLGNQNCGFAVR